MLGDQKHLLFIAIHVQFAAFQINSMAGLNFSLDEVVLAVARNVNLLTHN